MVQGEFNFKLTLHFFHNRLVKTTCVMAQKSLQPISWRARRKTASSISSVSLPVKVFC